MGLLRPCVNLLFVARTDNRINRCLPAAFKLIWLLKKIFDFHWEERQVQFSRPVLSNGQRHVGLYLCNGFQSSLLHFYFREELQKPIRSVKIHFQDCGRGAASLCFRNHRSCALKEDIRFGFRAGARAIRYSANMALGIRIHFFQLAYFWIRTSQNRWLTEVYYFKFKIISSFLIASNPMVISS